MAVGFSLRSIHTMRLTGARLFAYYLPLHLLSLFLMSLSGLIFSSPLRGETHTRAISKSSVVPGDDTPVIYRVLCTGQAGGCSCRPEKAPSRRGILTGSISLHHGEAVYQAGAIRSGSIPVTRPGGGSGFPCLYPRASLKRMHYAPVLHSRFQDLDQSPLPLGRLLGSQKTNDTILRELEEKKKKPLGLFWPTYYHLALEDFHPGPIVPVRSPDGHVITKASRPFLEQVAWEGSGITSKGIKLHYTGRPGLFERVTEAAWGWGAGSGYGVYPYRTIAVNFPAICARLKQEIPDCSKRKIIGLLVRIREVADGKIPVDGGTIHDGFFCASDTGSPYYIRSDRIDIFVGTDGGGNPFLPPARQGNRLIAGGIRNLLPSDWLLWRSDRERVWCDPRKLPGDGRHPRKGECTLDYHAVAPEKALHLETFWNRDGSPMRCKKGANL